MKRITSTTGRSSHRRLPACAAIAALTLPACTSDDVSTTSSTTTSTSQAADDSDAATTDDDAASDDLSASEPAPIDEVDPAPAQSGRALWRGVLMMSTDNVTYVPYGLTETIADYDEATFSTTTETSQGVTTLVGSETSTYLGFEDVASWTEIDHVRAASREALVPLSFEDGSPSMWFDATLQGEQHTVRRRVFIRPTDSIAAFVVADEWYLEQVLSRRVTTVSVHDGDDLLVVAEISERALSDSLPSPSLPTNALPVEALMNADSDESLKSVGFAKNASDDRGFASTPPISGSSAMANGLEPSFGTSVVSSRAQSSDVRFGLRAGIDGRPEQPPNPGIGDCWRGVDEIIWCEQPDGGGVHALGFPSGMPPGCATDSDGIVSCWQGSTPPSLEDEIGDDLIGAGAAIDRFCASFGPPATLAGAAVFVASVFVAAPVLLPVSGLLTLCGVWDAGQWLAGVVHGDPHITTVDGIGYNFQSGGEFVFFRRPDFEVQSRFLGNPGVATSAEATGVRVGEHVIEVYFDVVSSDTNDAGVPVTIDGVTTRLSGEGQYFDDGSFVARELGDPATTVIAVSPSGDVVRIENRAISQNIEMLVRVDPGNPGVGLAGTANGDHTDDFVARSGDVVALSATNTIDGLYTRFGESWRVQPDERLFGDVPADTFRTEEYFAVPDEYPSLARFDAEDRAAAEAACSEAGIPDGGALEDCAYDLLANPSEDWAAQAAGSSATSRRGDHDPRPRTSLSQTSTAAEPDAPIIVAAFQCDLAAVESLIHEDSDVVNAHATDDGWTPIMFAAQEGCADVATALVNAGASVDAVAPDGVYPLYLAAQNGHAEIVTLLAGDGSPVERSVEGGETPLLAAAYFGRESTVVSLLGFGADPNLRRRSDGFTPLIAASQNAIVGIVQSLLANGALLDLADNEGNTALISAVSNDAIDVASVLLEAGADVSTRSSSGSSVVQIATQRGNAELLDVLIQGGAPVNTADDEGFTPLIAASSNGDLGLVNRLLAAGADVTASTSDGATALFGPAFNGRTEVVAGLLDAGADASAARNDGITPLHLAAQESNDEVIELLLAGGANVNATDESGATPLHYAASNAFGSTVELLIAAGASCEVADGRDRTPADYASSDNRALLAAC